MGSGTTTARPGRGGGAKGESERAWGCCPARLGGSPAAPGAHTTIPPLGMRPPCPIQSVVAETCQGSSSGSTWKCCCAQGLNPHPRSRAEGSVGECPEPGRALPWKCGTGAPAVPPAPPSQAGAAQHPNCSLLPELPRRTRKQHLGLNSSKFGFSVPSLTPRAHERSSSVPAPAP